MKILDFGIAKAAALARGRTTPARRRGWPGSSRTCRPSWCAAADRSPIGYLLARHRAVGDGRGAAAVRGRERGETLRERADAARSPSRRGVATASLPRWTPSWRARWNASREPLRKRRGIRRTSWTLSGRDAVGDQAIPKLLAELSSAPPAKPKRDSLSANPTATRSRTAATADPADGTQERAVAIAAIAPSRRRSRPRMSAARR